MPSLLALTFDTSSGKWFAQKLGADQLSPGAIVSGIMASGSIGALNQIADGLFAATAEARGKFANAFLVSSLVGVGVLGGLQIRDGDILSGKYASQSIRTADLGLGQVLSAILGANAIDTAHIRNQGILSSSIGANTLGTPHIQNQGILSASFGAASIGTGHIANNTITSALIVALGIGTGHLGLNAVVSGKLGSGAIPDSSVSEAQLVSGISIDIAESLSEPTTIAAEPISGHAFVLFLSGFAGKRVGVAFANNPNKMPAVGKIGSTAVVSGGAMTTNPILSYGKQPSPISGYVQSLVYVGINGQPVVTAPSASGNLVQVMGQVMDNDGTFFLFPQPFAIAIAA